MFLLLSLWSLLLHKKINHLHRRLHGVRAPPACSPWTKRDCLGGSLPRGSPPGSPPGASTSQPLPSFASPIFLMGRSGLVADTVPTFIPFLLLAMTTCFCSACLVLRLCCHCGALRQPGEALLQPPASLSSLPLQPPSPPVWSRCAFGTLWTKLVTSQLHFRTGRPGECEENAMATRCPSYTPVRYHSVTARLLPPYGASHTTWLCSAAQLVLRLCHTALLLLVTPLGGLRCSLHRHPHLVLLLPPRRPRVLGAVPGSVCSGNRGSLRARTELYSLPSSGHLALSGDS